MKTIIYLSQVSACTGIFYLFYYLCLRKFTFFKLNRWYLLVTLAISFMIPLLTIPLQQGHDLPLVKQVVYVNTLQHLPEANGGLVVGAKITAPGINWSEIIKYLYYTGICFLFTRLIITLWGFVSILKHKNRNRIGSVTVLSGAKNLPNGSFLNYIFLNDESLQPHDVEQIIAHEMLHVKLKHSIDRIIVKITQIILWFNPFVYLYARCMEENHEFEVDSKITTSADKNQYANLLLHLCLSGRTHMLYHSFSKAPLKNRITMLFNQPTNNMKKLIYVLTIPVMMMSCLAFAQLKNEEPTRISAVGGIEGLGKNPLVTIDDKVYPKDILYKISGKCIKSSAIANANPASSDLQRRDGYAEIKTYEGKITYITDTERENLIKEAQIPKVQFFTRLKLKKEDGTYFDKAVVRFPTGGKISANFSTEGKVGFIIDKQVYNEDQIKNITTEMVSSIAGDYNVGPPMTQDVAGVDISGYEIVFTMHKKANVDKMDIVPSKF